MSHFIGLVFKHIDDDLEEILAPFNEQDDLYLVFHDETDNIKADYDKLPDTCPSEGKYTKTIDRTDLVNDIWDNAVDELAPEDEKEFWKPYTKKEFPTPADIARDKGYNIVEDLSKRDGLRYEQEIECDWQYEPSKEKYPTLDDYAKNYCGYRKLNGRYGYMSNPNAKWDWYDECGGRWGGYLKLKETEVVENEQFNEDGTPMLEDGKQVKKLEVQPKSTPRDYLTEVDWDKTPTPFCFVNLNGEWCEKGEMGWWAMVANEKPQADWDTEFKNYVKSLQEHELASEIEVVAVDFHI